MPLQLRKIDRYFPGKVITAKDLNAILDRLDQLSNIFSDQQVNIVSSANGIGIKLAKHITEIRRFYLLEDLAREGSANAELLYLDVNLALQHHTATQFQVKDVLNIFDGVIGDQGYCVKMSDTGNFWEIIQMNC